MPKGYLITGVLSVVLALSLALGIQTYRLSHSKATAASLKEANTALTLQREHEKKLYREVLTELETQRNNTHETRERIKELRHADESVDDWLNQPIPDGLLGLLR